MWLAVLAITVIIAGTLALLWLVWQSPHRNDLATYGSYAGAIAAVAVGLIGTVISTVTQARDRREKAQRGKHDGRVEGTLEFAHIGIIRQDAPRWKEGSHAYYDLDDGCPFAEKCDRYFYLDGDTDDAYFFLDVTVLNNAGAPVILSRVGAKILQVMHDPWGHAYGWPPPVKLLPPEDAYVLQTPNIVREIILQSKPQAVMDADRSMVVNREIWTNLLDPLYLAKKNTLSIRIVF